MRARISWILAIASVTVMPVAAQDPRPFVVGIWTGNDTILPFADFDGRRWRSSWPQQSPDPPDALALADIPAVWWGSSSVQLSWEAVDSGGSRRELHIIGTGSTGMGSSCSWNTGLKTDLPAGTYQAPQVLVASRPGAISPVQARTSDSPEWHAVTEVLPVVYQQHEAGAWKDVSEEWRPALAGRRLAPVLEVLLATTDEQGQYVYFESRRDYAPRPNQRGDMYTFVTGWLWRASADSQFQSIDIRSEATDPDRKGTDSFHPLGTVCRGNQRFGLGALGSYAYGGLTVLNVSRSGITRDGLPEVALPERHKAIQTFLFDRTHEALGVGRSSVHCTWLVPTKRRRQVDVFSTPSRRRRDYP